MPDSLGELTTRLGAYRETIKNLFPDSPRVRSALFYELAEEGLSLDSFAGVALEGQRRPLRVPLGESSCTPEGSDLRLEFTLPKGSYATSVLREITKNF